MTDDQIREELDRLAQRVRRDPPDLALLISTGHRQLRVRRAGLAVSGVAGAAVVALAASALAGGPAVDGPAVGLTATTTAPVTEPTGTATTSATASATKSAPPGVGSEVAISERGGQIQGYGFGVPVDSMAPATDGAGNVTLQPITLEEAVASCWPVLEQVVPGSSADDWTMTAPAGDFPSHATRYVGWMTADYTVATCVLPGGPVPLDAPVGPISMEPDDVLAACGALADVDLTGFVVETMAVDEGTAAVVLRSANDHLVRCVLSDDPAVRALQIHEDPIGTQPPLGDGLFYGTYWTTRFTSAGYVGPDAARVVVTIAGTETAVEVNDGFYSVVVPLDTPLSTEDDFHGRVEDAAGNVIWEGTWDDFGMMPAECLTSLEESHGC